MKHTKLHCPPSAFTGFFKARNSLLAKISATLVLIQLTTQASFAVTSQNPLPPDSPTPAVELVESPRRLQASNIANQQVLIDSLTTELAKRFAEPFIQLLEASEGGTVVSEAPSNIDMRNVTYRQTPTRENARSVFELIQSLVFHPEILARLSDGHKYRVEVRKRNAKIAGKVAAGVFVAAAIVAVIVVAEGDHDGDHWDFFSTPDVDILILDADDGNEVAGPSIFSATMETTPADIHAQFQQFYMKNPLFLNFLDKLMTELNERNAQNVPFLRRYVASRTWLAEQIESLVLQPQALQKNQAPAGNCGENL